MGLTSELDLALNARSPFAAKFMIYRCPLCLKILDKEDTLIRFCSKHRSGDNKIDYHTFKGDEDEIQNNIRCPAEDCRANYRIDEGVYLCHLGCKMLNPFWDAEREEIIIPATKGQQFEITASRKFSHWEIGMLRAVPKALRDNVAFEEMWFPAMSLRATAETLSGNRRMGNLVALAGAVGAGKTLLTMQAMDHDGYNSSQNPLIQIETQDYISCLPGSYANVHPTFQALELRSLMRDNSSRVYLPNSTISAAGNLFTVFFKPARKKTKQPATPVVENNKTLFGRSFFKKLKEEWEIGAAQEVAGESNSYWHTLAFYDISGEDDNVRADLIRDIEDAADKVAVVLDANNLFGDEEQAAHDLARTVERVKQLKRNEKKFCLVLTKMDDALREQPILCGDSTDELQAKIEKIAYAESVARQAFLQKMIAHQPSNRNMKKQLAGTVKDVPVFFICHLNLPTLKADDLNSPTPAAGGKAIEQPITIGLIPFICWCLEIDWSDVNEVED